MYFNRYVFSIIVLEFFFCLTPVYSQVPYDDCGGSGTLEGPYRLTFSDDPTFKGSGQKITHSILKSYRISTLHKFFIKIIHFHYFYLW